MPSRRPSPPVGSASAPSKSRCKPTHVHLNGIILRPSHLSRAEPRDEPKDLNVRQTENAGWDVSFRMPRLLFCYTFVWRCARARNRMISLFGKPEPTLAERLKASVSKTKAALSESVDTIFLGENKVDPALPNQPETPLLSPHPRATTPPTLLAPV